ncbi:AbrB/MazE/SpoVT family DNA-binding domain-containing protein [archaeon]|nr:AbrB/MazE/SpoVT family DNA-binding domain-containing protein [archaeon]
MTELEIVAKKWGNSFGFVIPKSVVEEENIKENEKFSVVLVRKSDTISKTFGLLKGKITESGQKIKDQLRKDLYD